MPTLDPALRRPIHLSHDETNDLLAFLGERTDPRALDLSHEVPESMPSSLPVDR